MQTRVLDYEWGNGHQMSRATAGRRPLLGRVAVIKRQKPQAPTPQAPIRNRQTRKVANAKGLNRNTNFT